MLRSLRFSLFNGTFPPGHTFSVPWLAEHYGVSATPVREAVLNLVQRGLVEAMPAKGFRIVDPSVQTIRETCELRKMIEIPATIGIAKIITPQQAAHLRTIAEETVRLAEKEDVAGFVELDYDFHRSLLELSGNMTLVDTVEDLRNRARVHIALLVAGGMWSAAIAQEHVELIDAMTARDLAEVERVVLQHMSYALPEDAAATS